MDGVGASLCPMHGWDTGVPALQPRQHARVREQREKKNKKAFAFTVGVLHTQIAARGLLRVPLMKEAQRRVL